MSDFNKKLGLALEITRLLKSLVILKNHAEAVAEYDCGYPNQPCLSVHISELSHGMCIGCRARLALKEAFDDTVTK